MSKDSELTEGNVIEYKGMILNNVIEYKGMILNNVIDCCLIGNI